MEAIFGRASIVGRGWGLMMRSPGILATATVAAAPAEAASDKGGGDQQWNHSNARMRLRPNCHCSSTMRLRECSKELPRLFHWPSQQRMLASATPVRNEQNGGSGGGYSKRYSKQVQHKYNDGDDGGNDTGRQNILNNIGMQSITKTAQTVDEEQCDVGKSKATSTRQGGTEKRWYFTKDSGLGLTTSTRGTATTAVRLLC